jgi:hypothetical protein
MNTAEQLEELRAELIEMGVVPKTAPTLIVKIFLEKCKALGINPKGDSLYVVQTFDPELGKSFNILATIGGLRLLASKIDDYEIIKKDVRENPYRAICEIKRGGKIVSEYCLYREYAPENLTGTLWKTKPAVMMGTTVEAMALRSAFPELHRVYIDSEFDRFRLEIGQDKIEKSMNDILKHIKK